MNLCYLMFLIIFIAFKIECGKIRPNFDEIFGNGWNNNKREGKVIKMEQIDQKEQNNNSAAVDQMGEGNRTYPNDQQKREIIRKFEAIKEKLKKRGKYLWKHNYKIEQKIGKLLGVNRKKIYKWKKEMNLNKKKIKIMKKSYYEQKKSEFIERFDEFKSLYRQGKQKEFMKELGISEETFRKWKKELVPNYYKSKTQIKYSNEDKMKKTKQYFKIKQNNPKISDKMIVKQFGIGIGVRTLFRWKKEFASVSKM